jgi:hypothetical protein
MHLSEFYKIYNGTFVLGPAVEKIYSQVRLKPYTQKSKSLFPTSSYCTLEVTVTVSIQLEAAFASYMKDAE